MAITSTGLGSGLDVNTIINSLMAVERRPAALLETAASNMKSQLSSYGQLQSYVSSFQDKARALNSVTLWGQTTATSSDTSTATVTTSGGAAAGQYSLEVNRLATAQTASTQAFASRTQSLGQGRLTIDLGNWEGDPATFGLKAGTSSVTVEIGPGETSLAAVRDKINAAGAGVTATVIYDATGARLSIRSSATGEENAFRIRAEQTVGPEDGGPGLDALAYDPEQSPGQGMSLNITAQNAQAKLNGLDISSASNTLSDVADGLTIKLLKTTPQGGAPVDVSVNQDSESMKAKVSEFVAAFNDLNKFISDQTKYNADSKVAGKLQGDRTVISLQSQMREILRSSSTASGKFSNLSEIGLEVQKDGSLKVNSSKLDAALAEPDELRKMLSGTDTSTETSSGLTYRFAQLTNRVLGVEGSLTTRQEGIQASISRNAKQVTAMETRLEQTEKRLRAQYQMLDANMASLNGLSSYMSAQLSSLGNIR